MWCQVADAWLEGPGGPLHDLIHAATFPRELHGPPKGSAALDAALALIEQFDAVQALVDKAQV